MFAGICPQNKIMSVLIKTTHSLKPGIRTGRLVGRKESGRTTSNGNRHCFSTFFSVIESNIGFLFEVETLI